jgi:predicted SprT family Zn-dependent metalloprotease
MSLDLMDRYGLAGWAFRFDHARRRFGCCRYGQKTITLSRSLVLLNSHEQVRDTVLHEIAHALTPGDGHGPRWKAKCIEVGAKPLRCYTDAAVRSPLRPAAKYRLGCGQCQWWVDRRRLTRNRYVCRRCSGPLIYEERALA